MLPVPPTRGGAIERWIRDAAGRLVRRGHEVHVISRDHGDGATTSNEGGVRYHFVRIPPGLDAGLAAAVARGLWYYARVRALLPAIGADVVHHHSRPAALWLCGSTAPSVISLHSMDYGWGFGYRGWDRPLFTRGLERADRVLCVSDFIRRHTGERYPSIAGKAVTVYNGVDGETFAPGQDAAALIGAGAQSEIPPVVLYVGRVEERKGVHVIVDAFERVISPRVPTARLKIVGPASYWKRGDLGYYDRLSKRCTENPRIELRGPTYDDGELSAIYRTAAVAVVPSTFPEALGLTSLEAQASGVPVVVSDAGGLAETVAPGRSGFVFANHNVDQLGELVVDVLANAERRRTMGMAAREWAMETFSWDVIAARLEAQYMLVRQGHGARAS
ncbi:MAG TPA: glycosyltransferase family 4 protein [Vicinamibacterales bacterium]|nr:glycosyltransferase family 4 protein [Vicinamibacterales bacterium]